MMKKMMIPVLAVAAVSMAVPAAAQSYGQPYGHQGPSRGPAYQQQHNGWQSISQRKYNLDRRIDQGLRNRQLSRREASRLKAELNSLVRLEMQYSRNGLSRAERVDLDRRYDRLSAMVRAERRDHDGRRR